MSAPKKTKGSRKAPSGAKEAVAMLRNLERLNWKRDAWAQSRKVVAKTISTAQAWPAQRRDAFFQVISDWLVEEVMGFGFDLNEYERYVETGKGRRP